MTTPVPEQMHTDDTASAAQPAEASREQVLIVDDTPVNLDLLSQLLEENGYDVLVAASGEAAIRLASASPQVSPDLILLDVVMHEMDGFETCRQLKVIERFADVPVLFISARDETSFQVSGFAAGAVDYIVKPFDSDEVLSRVATHMKIGRLTRELRQNNALLERKSQELSAANESLRCEVDRRRKAEDALHNADEKLSAISDREAERWGVAGFIGQSRTIHKILQEVRQVQNFGSVNVLITGESGTGKELVARAIHFGSARAKLPFVPVNCVAIPEELAESMLFGHVRGAFTGATMDRKGFFELADGGTLFLDEIGDMPVTLQAKLLRVLEDGKITPLGTTREKKVDVRVVAATNANLAVQIGTGAFRQDLFFRLAQYTVELPPLRERREDIALLAGHFMTLFASEMGLPTPRITAEAVDALTDYDFPGNVRELKNVIERALIKSGGRDIRREQLFLTPRAPLRQTTLQSPTPVGPPPSAVNTAAGGADDLPLNLQAAENLLIKRALQITGGNIAEAARRLGVNRTRIYRKLSEAEHE